MLNSNILMITIFNNKTALPWESGLFMLCSLPICKNSTSDCGKAPEYGAYILFQFFLKTNTVSHRNILPVIGNQLVTPVFVKSHCVGQAFASFQNTL